MNSSTQTLPFQTQQTESAAPGKFTGSFAQLAMRGGDWKCTVDASSDKSVSSGVTYISGGKMRADFTSAVSGFGNAESHVISDGTNVYTWSSLMPQGIKTKVTAQGQGGTQTSGSGSNQNQSYTYDCQPWSADTSLFAVPTNITFKEVGQ